MRQTMPPSFSSTIRMPPLPISFTHCPCGKSTIALSPSAERHSPHVHSAQIPFPLVRNPTRCVLIHAKRNATLGPPHHAQSRSRVRAGVGERCTVFLATKSRTAVPVTTQQKRARSSVIAHAWFSALVVYINVAECVVYLCL